MAAAAETRDASAAVSSKKNDDIPPQAFASEPHTPFFPTSTETLLFSLYFLTILIGTVSSNLYGTSDSYSADLQAHDPALAPSYFALKKNVFNVLFVKRGWLWTTLAFGYFLAIEHKPSVLTGGLTASKARAALRWGLVTIWWILVTQWFFGPPIMDRGFTLTGGKCELQPATNLDPEVTSASDVVFYLSSFECRRRGGIWKGGYDLSGHIFLLTLGSLFLLLEVLPVAFSNSSSAQAKAAEKDEMAVAPKSWPLRAIGALVVLWWWMLLMTSVFFHTWHEKITAFAFALGGIYVIYILPRSVSTLYSILGRPGL